MKHAPIEKLAAVFGACFNQLMAIRLKQNHRQQGGQLCITLQFLAVMPGLPVLATPDQSKPLCWWRCFNFAGCFCRAMVFTVLNDHAGLITTMLDPVFRAAVTKGLALGENVYRFQYAGLAGTIGTVKYIDSPGKLQIDVVEISDLADLQTL